MADFPLLIDGTERETGRWLEVTSPYDGTLVGRIAQAGAQEAAEAMDAARIAFSGRPPLPHERGAVLERAAVLLQERREEVALGIAEEAGKPIMAARTEVDRCTDTLRFSAIEARTLTGSVVPFEGSASGPGKFGYTIVKPRGVITAITPFNFPLNLVAHKVAPALAAGCPVVVKPASDTPLTAVRLARILIEAGVPRGHLQVVAGPSGEIGEVLTGHASVAVISFTGSPEVGRRLQAQHPGTRVLMELGNNAPVIVDRTADLELAAAKLALAANSFAGQSCISAQRIYVHESVHKDFVRLLKVETERLPVGNPLAEDTVVGPLIRPEERERVVAWIRDAVGAGAKTLCGGTVNEDGTLNPTVLVDVSPTMAVCREEVFGPVLAVQRVESLEEAIALANDTKFGLQAGIFTSDIGSAITASEQLSFGGVTINETPTFRVDQQPYGGMRDSGNTREGPAWAIHEYLEETVVIWQRVAPRG